MQDIFLTGIRFFILGLLTMVITNSDNLVISHFMGVKYVTQYSISYKIFTILFSIIYQFVGALLPLISREIGNGNWDWIKGKYEIGIEILAFLGGLTWIGTFLLSKDVIILWTKDANLFPGIWVVFFLGGYAYFLAMGNLNAGLVNILNYSKESIIIVASDLLINISLSIYLSQFIGLIGIAIGTFVGTFITSGIFYPLVIRKKTVIKYDYSRIVKHFIIVIFPTIIVAYIVIFSNNNSFTRIMLSLALILIYIVLSFLYFKRTLINAIKKK